MSRVRQPARLALLQRAAPDRPSASRLFASSGRKNVPKYFFIWAFFFPWLFRGPNHYPLPTPLSSAYGGFFSRFPTRPFLCLNSCFSQSFSESSFLRPLSPPPNKSCPQCKGRKGESPNRGDSAGTSWKQLVGKSASDGAGDEWGRWELLKRPPIFNRQPGTLE